MYKRKKLKNKKLRRGGTTGFEGSPELGGQRGNFDYESAATFGNEMGMTSTPSTGGSGAQSQTAQARKTLLSKDRTTSAAVSAIGKGVFDVTGAGLVYSGLKTGIKKAGSKITQALTPQIQKKTAEARLSGSPIYDYKKPTLPIEVADGGNGDNLTNILKKPLKPVKTEVASFRPKDFFPFQAYKSGGVPSGPPPLKGPNSQIPPIKMRKGKMTKSYKFSCPSRPDGIRGMGAAIKGHKFTGVK